MDIAIIGAGRNKNGIGHYIGKFFQKNGARVVAVLGTTPVSAKQAAQALDDNGNHPSAYTDFRNLLENKVVDAVVIASPNVTHLAYLTACIDAGVHMFCEKPLLHPDMPDLPKTLEKLLAAINKNRLILAMNSQWPFAMPDYERLCGRISPEAMASFCIHLSPLADGLEMIPDSVPHALSLMYHVLGKGQLADLSISRGDGVMTLTGIYQARMTDCRFQIHLTRHTHQPRPFSFGWNGRMVHRRLTMEPYEISFQHKEDILTICDPLELSVKNFIAATSGSDLSPVGPAHILETTSMLNHIYKIGKRMNERKQETE